MHEVDKITNEIREQVHPDADVIVGSIFDENLEGKARVSVVATGLAPNDKPSKRIIDLQVNNGSSVSSIPATQANGTGSVHASANQEEATHKTQYLLLLEIKNYHLIKAYSNKKGKVFQSIKIQY